MILLVICLIIGMIVCKTMKGAALFGCLSFLVVLAAITFLCVGMVASMHP